MLEFLITCRLYIRIRMRDTVVKEQVQWVLSYMQGELVNIWKENIIEDLKSRSLSYVTVEEFLSDLKEEFGGRDDEMIKLKKIEQESKKMEEFVQEFRRAVRKSRYEGRPLVKVFKRGMNEVIQQKLIELECSSGILNSSMSKQQIWIGTEERVSKKKRLKGRRKTKA